MRIIYFLFVLFFSQPLLAATLTASADRTQTSRHGFLEYSVSYSGNKTLSGSDVARGLTRDFEIVGQNRSQEIIFKNNKRSVITKLGFTLQPKKEGELTIPAFNFDNLSTQPIKITVTTQAAPKSTISVGTPKEIFVTASIDNPSPYVNAQTMLTLKTYDSVGIIRGVLNVPEIASTLSKSFESKNEYDETINGVRYKVQEQKVALFPLKSGELVIPAITLNADIPQKKQIFDSSSSLFSPSLFSLMPSFALSSRISVPAEEIKLTVRAVPKKARNESFWLPAKAVKLRANFDESSRMRVGESITRYITIDATGMHAAGLPDLKLPEISGVRHYSGNTESKESLYDGNMIASKTKAFIFIPSEAGTLILPELRVPWFNTKTQKLEYAILPAETLNIMPNPNAKNTASTEKEPTASSDGFSKTMLIFVLIFLLLIAALLIQIYLRTHSIAGAPKEKKEKPDVTNPEGLAQAVVKNANQAFPAEKFLSVMEVAKFLGNASFKNLMISLSEAVYKKTPFTHSIQAVLAKLDSLIKEKKKKVAADILPKLYKKDE